MTSELPTAAIPKGADLLGITQNALSDMKAVDPIVLDVRELSSVTDYMVVASGTSSRHVKSLANSVLMEAKAQGARPLGVEGAGAGEWARPVRWLPLVERLNRRFVCGQRAATRAQAEDDDGTCCGEYNAIFFPGADREVDALLPPLRDGDGRAGDKYNFTANRRRENKRLRRRPRRRRFHERHGLQQPTGRLLAPRLFGCPGDNESREAAARLPAGPKEEDASCCQLLRVSLSVIVLLSFSFSLSFFSSKNPNDS